MWKSLESYYHLKPFIPRCLQVLVRRMIARRRLAHYCHIWPIDERASKVPENWPGWPDGKRFALVLTHDVEFQHGHDRCLDLARMDMDFGIRSSFNFVPLRYCISGELRSQLAALGFEVGVHGLYHDGKYFNSREIFLQRAAHINRFLKEWGAVGFRAPSMLHNLDWILDLNILYDASTFDTDPFEPQSDGVGTIFPFWHGNPHNGRGYVELPYTIPQDFTVFVLLKEKNIDIWKKKLDWIARKGGMALLNVHPDYMHFGKGSPGREEYPALLYQDFLKYLEDQYKGLYWNILPRDLAAWCGRFFSPFRGRIK